MGEERRSRARRGLDEAAGFLDAYRREAGVEPAPDLSEAARGAAEASLRAALEAAREKLETLSREAAVQKAEAAAARGEVERLRRELEGRPQPGAAEAARAEAEEAARRSRLELEGRCASLEERLTLMAAEQVRVDALRRKAEHGAAESEAARRAIEDALRRELRAAHAALDRAAAEAGAREAKARADIEPLRTRLENSLLRLEQLERERSQEGSKVRAQVAAAALEARAAEEETARALAVAATLRKELERVKQLLDDRESGLQGRVDALEQNLAAARAESAAAQEAARLDTAAAQEAARREVSAAREEAAAAHKGLAEARLDAAASAAMRRDYERLKVLAAERESTLRGRIEALEKALESARLEGAQPLLGEGPLLYDPDLPTLPEYTAPPTEPVLDPGWGRLLRLVRPSVEAAYAHLRRLSAAPLKPGAKSLVRLAAASIASATDALSSIELALSESPAPAEPADAAPVLEQCLAAWEPALRKRGVSVSRDIKPGLPKAPADPAALRVMLFHVLRNELEALPKGARLTVKALKTADGALRFEFSDDGPGYPAAWLERRFEPFAAPRKGRAGLGLSIVRRTMRRWGGEAEASNVPGGKGARLSLTFAPPLPPGPAMI